MPSARHGKLPALPPQPPQPRLGRRQRFVFAADPAGVAQAVEQVKEVGVVDFAGAWLVAAWVVGDLDVADVRQIGFDGARQIALDDLRVVKIELQFHIFTVDGLQEAKTLLHIVEPVAGHVDAAVDRLNHHGHARLCQTIRRVAQVGDVNGFELGFVNTRRAQAGHAVHALAVERLGIDQRLLDAGGKFILPPRQAGEAALTGKPVARRKIE